LKADDEALLKTFGLSKKQLVLDGVLLRNFRLGSRLEALDHVYLDESLL
jgi:hypothetical protein